MNREDFLKECIEYFGETKQQAVCVEEMAELTQQLCKFMIDHPNKSREKLVEEYVDVLIMLNQMKIIFNITDEEVENGKVFKLARLKKFIDSHRTPRAADFGCCLEKISISVQRPKPLTQIRSAARCKGVL